MTKLRVVPNAAHWNDFFYGNPEYFHVCYHWKDRIEFEIANPDEPCAWYMQGDGKAEEPEAQASTAAPVCGAWRWMVCVDFTPTGGAYPFM